MTATPFVVDAASVTGRPSRQGSLIERAALGAHTDAAWLSLSVLELEAAGTCDRETGGAEEVLYVLSGHGTLCAADAQHELEPEAGVYLSPGLDYELSAPPDEDLLIVSVRVPDPVAPVDGHGAVVRRLADLDTGTATAERSFRIISDPDSGLRSGTHFVGYVPPGRAADHFHTYDEVIYVLDGAGAFHAAEQSWTLGPGSCISLPARTVHCLENTGDDVLRVMAVFRPAGSPAAAYYPDGTPAHYDNEQSLQEEVQA